MTTETHSLTLKYKDGGLAAGTKALDKFAESGSKASKSALLFTGKVGLLNTQIKTMGTVTLPKAVSSFERFTKGFKPAKNATQLLAFQMQDLAVQLSMGTSALTAFGQQSPQAFSAFGASGAVIGAIAGVGFALAGPLITALSDTQVEAETLDETMTRLGSGFEHAADGSDILSRELIRLAKISREAVRLRLIVDQEDSIKVVTELRNSIGDAIFSFSSARSALEKLGGVTTFDKLAEGLGITSIEAERLSNAQIDIADKFNPSAYSNLAKVVSDLKDSYGDSNSSLNALSGVLSRDIAKTLEAVTATKRLQTANDDLNKSIDEGMANRTRGDSFSDPEGELLRHRLELNKQDVADKKRTEAEKTRLAASGVRQREAIERASISVATTTMGQLVEIAKAGGEESFQAYKRLAQSQAALSAALGVMAVIADPLIPTIAKPFAIGATLGLAAVQIASIDSQQYSARENGGQVQAGSKILVGERGPEVLELGAQGGFVTPNSRLGGGGSSTVVFQIGNGVQPNVRSEVMAMAPDIMRMVNQSMKGRR